MEGGMGECCAGPPPFCEVLIHTKRGNRAIRRRTWPEALFPPSKASGQFSAGYPSKEAAWPQPANFAEFLVHYRGRVNELLFLREELVDRTFEDLHPLAVGGHNVFGICEYPVEARAAYDCVFVGRLVPVEDRIFARTPRDVVVGELADIAIDYFVVAPSGHHVVGALAG